MPTGQRGAATPETRGLHSVTARRDCGNDRGSTAGNYAVCARGFRLHFPRAASNVNHDGLLQGGNREGRPTRVPYHLAQNSRSRNRRGGPPAFPAVTAGAQSPLRSVFVFSDEYIVFSDARLQGLDKPMAAGF